MMAAVPWIGMILVLYSLVFQGQAEEVCFGDLECFDDDDCHAIGFPPEKPEFINTRFFLYTRRNWNTSQELVLGDTMGIRGSNFDPKKKTKFSIHGWNSNAFGSGERSRKDIFLREEDLNYISVDWRRGARGINYWKQHQNTRVVGRVIALMARELNLMGMYYKDVHLMGHSLGAHTAGYAGAFQPGFGRITGTDPAGPLYRKDKPNCRLDPSDALFVDVIHSDGNDYIGLGASIPMGHQDFYPNGGRHQPECPYGTDLLGGCSHGYAFRYFTESIRVDVCQFKAYPCPGFKPYMAGLCGACGTGCSVMGYPAEHYQQLRGQFYLDTNDESPYCIPVN